MLDHKKIENAVKKIWEEEKSYEKLKEMEKSRENKLYFLDGPPYVTGEIHPGTAWNKVMKDAYIRFYRMLGYKVRDQPGFDTHGLPIEVKVEKLLSIEDKKEIEKIGIERFIKECKAFADKYIRIMTEQFKAFGVWMDWDNPYITYKDSYIEKSWDTIKRAYEKGLLKEDLYVLPYCWRCQTTLANYELEYKDKTSPSIYVKFEFEDGFLIVWTTTPWTLVSNVGVMVHPSEEYVKVNVDGEHWIVAEKRLEFLKEKLNINPVVVEKFKGKDIEGLRYKHPFEEYLPSVERKVVLSDSVTMEEGTGLVHLSPAHGPEDFKVGKAYGMPILQFLDERGVFKNPERFKGKHWQDVNEEVINLLRDRGNLVKYEKVRHRYPHCWRCKNPLVYKSTVQWFIEISKLKEKMKEGAINVEWLPSFAKERFLLFLDAAPDWCISRQRYWGIPLPIWRCENNHIIVFSSKEELEKRSGKKIKELHRPYVDEITFNCPVCGKESSRVKDVLDVWFDSGNAPWASLDNVNLEPVADVILEGQDQIRGWFYSLLGSGVVAIDRVPYKKVIMHGFFLDEKGEKMSKSLGNFVAVDEILDRVGADAFRLFVLSNTPWEDLKFSWKELEIAKRELSTFLNMVEFAYSRDVGLEGEEKIEDIYIKSRLNSIIEIYLDKFDKGFSKAVKELRQFIMDDLSRFYMKLVKDRIKQGDGYALSTLREVLQKTTLMLAPIVPFFAEYVWVEKFKRNDSVHWQYLPQPNRLEINKEIEEKVKHAIEVVEEALRIRNEAGIGLRWPLRKLYAPNVKGVEDILKRLVNVKEVEEFEEVKLELELDEELRREGYLNELLRRIQHMRKEMGLRESDKINLEVDGDNYLLDVFESFKDVISNKANVVSFSTKKPSLVKEWSIKGKKVVIKVEKLGDNDEVV